MKEDFLHYLWRMKRFDMNALTTTEGESIMILESGEHNHNAGPDFLNAKLQIGNTVWAGNVEIHVLASEWIAHKHQNDLAYNNVILHVVLEEDKVIHRNTGGRIPCLELKKRIPPKLISKYEKLIHNEFWIPCQHHIHKVKEITKNIWLDRLLVERLERKTNAIVQSLSNNNNNWEESFYLFLARSFGVKHNADAFEQLARILPFQILLKHKSSLLQIEALLFGQAGLLEQAFNDDYPNKLKKEYLFLKEKFNLQPMNPAGWKFMRMRPANFPSIRIAQFAVLIFQSHHLFSKALAAQNVKEFENMLDLKLSNYWLTHYTFDKESTKRKKSLGKQTIHLFIINTIAPFLFIYGKMKDEQQYKDKALRLLESMDAEKNSIIKKWIGLGFEVSTAYETQALIQLKGNYCDKKKCTQCAIGNSILKEA